MRASKKAIDLGFADRMVADRWRLDAAAHASPSAPVPFKSSLVDRAGPVLEGTEIVDLVVTHIFEQLAGEGCSPAGDAIEDYGFSFFEILVVMLTFRVGAEFDPAACGDLSWVADIKDKGIALRYHVGGLILRDYWNSGVRSFQHFFDVCRHLALL